MISAAGWLKGSGFDEVCPPNGSYRLLSPPSSLALSLGAMSRRCGGSGASMMVRIGDFGGGGTVEEHTPTNFVVDLDFPAVYRALQGEQSRSGHLKSTQCAEVMLLHVRLTPPLPRGIPKVHVVSGRGLRRALVRRIPPLSPNRSLDSRQVPSAAICSLWPNETRLAVQGAAEGAPYTWTATQSMIPLYHPYIENEDTANQDGAFGDIQAVPVPFGGLAAHCNQ